MNTQDRNDLLPLETAIPHRLDKIGLALDNRPGIMLAHQKDDDRRFLHLELITHAAAGPACARRPAWVALVGQYEKLAAY